MNKKEGKILVIDDDEDILLTAKVVLKRRFEKIRTITSPLKVNRLLSQEDYDVILLDMNFTTGATSGKEGFAALREIKKLSPETNVVMMTAYGDIDLAVNAMKEGATDFVVKPWDNQKLLATVISAYKLSCSEREVHELQNKQQVLSRDIDLPFAEMVGQSPEMEKVFKTIEKVAPTDANVLILGENGTGKELVARALHRQSARNRNIFLSVDLGAIPETLFESELFGHKKGAFTDAREDRKGRFELASGGTLFLDEIGNLSASLQSKLLTALQNREIIPIGANASVPIDVRIISATNMPIFDMAESSTFRQDLLYRINTVVIKLPALRQRQGDIPLLAQHFLKMQTKKYNKEGMTFTKEGLNKLSKYHFPGNVRELQHIIERAVIMSDGNTLRPSDFLFTIEKKARKADNLNLEDVEKQAIIEAINKHHGNLTQAAKELGLGRTTMYRKMKKYDL